MPIYDYLCEECGKRFTVLIGVVQESDDESCPHCSSKHTKRLIGRFARVRSEEERLSDVEDKLERMHEPDSYSEIRRTMREMGSAMDDDSADDLEELFEEDIEGKSDEEE
ncbi:MAG TPA: zinc ribbon domain-containing protein [Fimbriimonadales bacterium]|nr:zinc ribbon domain-containing protein [Fimbriimonadales bacterium]